MTAREHNRLAGIFLMAHGTLQAGVLLFIFLIYGIVGGAMIVGSTQQEGKIVGAAFIGVVVLIGVIASVFIAPQILGGYKLYKELPNARNWGIVGSIFSCLSFPLGTAAGVYGLWFLFGDIGKNFYLGGRAPQYIADPTAPPPNSWQ